MMDAAKPNTTYSYTTLKKILAQVKLRCRVHNTTLQDVFIIPAIIECAKEMKTELDYEQKTATLPINNYMAELPCEFMRFNKPNPIVFTTNGQVDYDQYYSFFNVTYTGQAFMTCSPFQADTDTYWGVPSVQIQGGHLQFSNNITATECTISFEAALVDEEGEIKIPSANERPIVEGASYIFKRDRGDPPSAYMDHKLLWVNGSQNRRGEANQPDELKLQRLGYMWNRMFL